MAPAGHLWHSAGMSQDDPRSAIGAFLDSVHAEQTAFLADLVRVPSDNPPGDCARARTAELLERLRFAVERHPAPEALVREVIALMLLELLTKRGS